MKKMPCLFQRDFSSPDRPVLLPVVTPGCEWVLAGEGLATRKFDGTACLISNGSLYARFDVKIDPRTGKRKPFPVGTLIPCDDAPDPVTGHWPHWIMVTDQPQYQYHRAAAQNTVGPLDDGTYEACGPHFQTNPEGFATDVLVRHGFHVYPLSKSDLTFEGLRAFLAPLDIEGLVFHRGDTDHTMCKIRKNDYGLLRKP